MLFFCGQWKNGDWPLGCINLTRQSLLSSFFHHSTDPLLFTICAGNTAARGDVNVCNVSRSCILPQDTWSEIYLNQRTAYNYWDIPLALFQFLWCLPDSHQNILFHECFIVQIHRSLRLAPAACHVVVPPTA
jgi:hypothetical protein